MSLSTKRNGSMSGAWYRSRTLWAVEVAAYAPFMNPDIVGTFDVIFRRLRDEIEGLNDETLGWKPMPEASSISSLVLHVVGTLVELLTVVSGTATPRNRDADFASGSSVRLKELQARIDESQVAFQEAALQITEEDLASLRSRPPWGTTKSGLAWLFIAFGHAHEHLGQIQITKQLHGSSAQPW